MPRQIAAALSITSTTSFRMVIIALLLLPGDQLGPDFPQRFGPLVAHGLPDHGGAVRGDLHRPDALGPLPRRLHSDRRRLLVARRREHRPLLRPVPTDVLRLLGLPGGVDHAAVLRR